MGRRRFHIVVLSACVDLLSDEWYIALFQRKCSNQSGVALKALIDSENGNFDAHISLRTIRVHSETRNSSEDEIANVNFLYDDIVHALQNTTDLCINSATDGRGYVLEHRFTKFSEIKQCNGHFAVQSHSRSPILIPIESSYDFLLVINTNLPLTRFASYGWLLVKFSLARAECLTLTLSRGWPLPKSPEMMYCYNYRFFRLHFRCRKY